MSASGMDRLLLWDSGKSIAAPWSCDGGGCRAIGQLSPKLLEKFHDAVGQLSTVSAGRVQLPISSQIDSSLGVVFSKFQDVVTPADIVAQVERFKTDPAARAGSTAWSGSVRAPGD